jgi:hypothetical protein
VDVGREIGLLNGLGRLRNVSPSDIHLLGLAIGLDLFLEGNESREFGGFPLLGDRVIF